MLSVAEKRGPILILEDSRMDRARFRLLLSGKEAYYDFAWAWKHGDGCSVLTWLEKEAGAVAKRTNSSPESRPGNSVRRLLDHYDELVQSLRSSKLLLLDLAWSNQAETVMQDLQHVTRQEGNTWARANPRAHRELARLLENVEGIALLEWLQKNGWQASDADQPAVWVTSAYVPMTAGGLREFLQVRYGLQPGPHLFHKWLDEASLVSDLNSFIGALKANR